MYLTGEGHPELETLPLCSDIGMLQALGGTLIQQNLEKIREVCAHVCRSSFAGTKDSQLLVPRAAILLEKKACAFILKTPCTISHDTSYCKPGP